MNMLPATRAATKDWFGIIMNPFQYNATNVHDRGNETVGKCNWIGRSFRRNCSTVRLAKFSSSKPSAQPKQELTSNAVNAKCKTLFAMK